MNHLLGQTCALLAAITWACALVLLKRSGERIQPVSLNLYKNAVGLTLLIATLAVLTATGCESMQTLLQLSTGDICLLLLSGIVGIALADTLFLHALNLIGVGLMSVMDCTYTPIAVLFAWVLLSEKLTVFHYVGAGLIVAGVFIASRHSPPVNRTRRQIVGGMFLAVLAIAMMALGIVLPKPILERTGVLWATTIRLVPGFGMLALFALLGRGWKQHWRVFRPSGLWCVALPASILGTYLSMVFWVAGFKYTYASVAAVLNQTSVIFASILAAVFLREHFGGRKIASLLLALVGVFIVTFSDWLATHGPVWLGMIGIGG